MKRLISVVLLVLLFLAITYNLIPMTYVYAEVPHLINYQGRLTDKDNRPLEGTHTLTFRIYDVETSGNLLWEETHASILIQKGIFSVLLGSVTDLNLLFDKPYFLEIKANNEVMSPRQRITSSGYAIRAEKAEDANTLVTVGVSTTPMPNKILPLDGNATFPFSALGLKVYDSGWFPVTGGNDYTKTHNLGTTKALVAIYSASDTSGTGMQLDYPSNTYTGIIGIQVPLITPTQIVISPSGSGFHYIAGGSPGYTREQVTSGYARIIMLALE